MKKPKTQNPIYWVDSDGGVRVFYWISDEYGVVRMISRQEYQFHRIEELLEKILKKLK